MNEYIVILLLILSLSATGSWFINSRKQVDKPVKIMLFVLYFWASSFVLLGLTALGYFLLGKMG